MEPRFEQFIRERQYLTNVTPATIEWYDRCFKWLSSPTPSQDDLNSTVMRMREKGLKATGCNSVIRAVNSYLNWSGSALKIKQLREPKLVLPTFTEQQIRLLVSWKAKSKYQRRLHLLVLFLLDTGCRISEALTVRVNDLNFDDLLVTLDGKGRKQRVVPFSFELRKAMFRYCQQYGRKPDSLLFANRTDALLNRRNVIRRVKLLCEDLGFTPPARTLHSFRHTFAINYLRRGGSVFHLQKVLGHSTLEMTRRYANLVTADLQAVHERISLLSK